MDDQYFDLSDDSSIDDNSDDNSSDNETTADNDYSCMDGNYMIRSMLSNDNCELFQQLINIGKITYDSNIEAYIASEFIRHQLCSMRHILGITRRNEMTLINLLFHAGCHNIIKYLFETDGVLEQMPSITLSLHNILWYSKFYFNSYDLFDTYILILLSIGRRIRNVDFVHIFMYNNVVDLEYILKNYYHMIENRNDILLMLLKELRSYKFDKNTNYQNILHKFHLCFEYGFDPNDFRMIQYDILAVFNKDEIDAYLKNVQHDKYIPLPRAFPKQLPLHDLLVNFWQSRTYERDASFKSFYYSLIQLFLQYGADPYLPSHVVVLNRDYIRDIGCEPAFITIPKTSDGTINNRNAINLVPDKTIKALFQDFTRVSNLDVNKIINNPHGYLSTIINNGFHFLLEPVCKVLQKTYEPTALQLILNTSIETNSDNTYLHLICKDINDHRSWRLIKCLFEYGADFFLPNAKGKTAFHYLQNNFDGYSRYNQEINILTIKLLYRRRDSYVSRLVPDLIQYLSNFLK
jgi:hypothetical protein